MANSTYSAADVERITEALRRAPELLERLIGFIGGDGGFTDGTREADADVDLYVTPLPSPVESGARDGGPLEAPPGAGWRLGQIIGQPLPGAPAWVLWSRMRSAAPAVPSPTHVTADDLWAWHRAILQGRSSATGAALCEKLEGCPPGAQGAHWGLALILALLLGQDAPPVPPGISAYDENRIRGLAAEIIASRGKA